MKPTNQYRNDPSESQEILWSTPDVAKFLRCSERQVYSLRQQGLPAIQVGGMVRFDPAKVRAWLSEKDYYSPSDERGRQLSNIAETGDEDNSEVCCDELERQSFDHRYIQLPFNRKLSWSLLCSLPEGAYIVSLTSGSDGSSLFTGKIGEISERRSMWFAIRDAGADQRIAHITTDGSVAEAFARPFPTNPEERDKDIKLRCALLSGRPATTDDH